MIQSQIIVYKNRTNVIQVSLGIDVSGDTFTSEIREKVSQNSPLIASWDVSFLTDGTDGMLVLTIDDTDLSNIEPTVGYMDVIRISSGEPLPAFKGKIRVILEETVTEWP